MKKKGMEAKSVAITIISLLIFLAVGLYLYLKITGKGESAFAFIKNLFRFGGTA